MWCFRYRRLLIPYSEGSLGDRARQAVERHVSVCRGCAADLEDIRAVCGVLRSAEVTAVEPAADLWSKVSERIADGATPARRSYRRLPHAASAFAGAVVVAAVGFYAMRTELQPVAPTPADRQARVAAGAPGREEASAPAAAEFGQPKKPGAAVYYRSPGKPAGAGGTPNVVASAHPSAPSSASSPADPLPMPSSPARVVSEPPAAAPAPELMFGSLGAVRSRPGLAPEESLDDKADLRADTGLRAASPAPDADSSLAYSMTDAPASAKSTGLMCADAVLGRPLLGADRAAETEESVVDVLNETEGVRTAALFTYP